jgi:AraC family transcriptional regulator, arabinose operon regulatory protein
MAATTSLHAATHRHPQHEMVLVRSGSLRVRCRDGVLTGQAGTLHIFPAGCEHDQGCNGPWSTICLLVSGDDPLLDDEARAIDTGDDPLLSTWFDQLCPLAAGADPDDRAAADALLTAVLHRIRRLGRDRDLRERRPPALVQALELIDASLDRDLDVARLAAEVGLSPSHLGSLFRAHLGRSPKQHHGTLRLERARVQLANPYTTVSAVAQALGFADLNWFVRRFRTEFGSPPGRWRQDALSRQRQRGPGPNRVHRPGPG